MVCSAGLRIHCDFTTFAGVCLYTGNPSSACVKMSAWYALLARCTLGGIWKEPGGYAETVKRGAEAARPRAAAQQLA